MMRRIDLLQLQHFRGATGETIITFTQPMVVIFGENGTGKSTIIDAIDLICNKKPGSLSERSSTHAKTHLPSIGQRPADLKVSLHSGHEAWIGAYKSKEIEVSGPTAPPVVHILRRGQLLQLIEAKPAERFDALRRFVEVERIEQSEAALNEAVKDADKRVQLAAAQCAGAEQALQELWRAEGTPDGSPLAWAQNKSSVTTEKLAAKNAILEQLLVEVQQAQRCHGDLQQAVLNLSVAQQTQEQSLNALQQLDGANGTAAAELVSLLSAVLAYLTPPHEFTECPVCRHTVAPDHLRQELQSRIVAMEQYEQAAGKIATARNAVLLLADNLTRWQQDFLSAVQILSNNLQTSPVPEVKQRQLDWTHYAPLGQAGLSSDAGMIELAASFMREIDDLTAALFEHRNRVQKDLHLHGAIHGYYRTITTGRQSAQAEEAVLNGLKKALQCMRNLRISFTQGVLNDVADECNRLYRLLHPDEPLGALRLSMDVNRRGSLLQHAEFAGVPDIPPQAYFSDAHLDTLGFCLFLAIAKYRNDKNAIVVLDDILTSVDTAHVARIVDLLDAESANFAQIIIATHSRNWLERYRYMRGQVDNIDLLSLRRWSRPTGIRIEQTRSVIEELAQALGEEPFDRLAVAAQAGALLESVLDELALCYQCYVPRTPDNRFTLGELLSAVWKLTRVLAVRHHEEGPAMPIAPLVDDFAKMTFIRHIVGSQWHPGEDEVSDRELREFGQRTATFASTLVCEDCGGIPFRADGTQYRCACARTTMTPLVFH